MLTRTSFEYLIDARERPDVWRGSPEPAEQALDRTIDVLRRRFGVRRR